MLFTGNFQSLCECVWERGFPHNLLFKRENDDVLWDFGVPYFPTNPYQWDAMDRLKGN
jgi:hypothetical protein